MGDDRIVLILREFEQDRASIRAEFVQPENVAVEPLAEDGDIGFPWLIVGIDALALGGDRHRFHIQCDELALSFDALWPSVGEQSDANIALENDDFRLSLRHYRAWLHAIPRPTGAQVYAFVEHVTRMHSWYKHLPLTGPGSPFVFFLDRNAGLQRMRRPDGSEEFVTITGESEQFHYSIQPTALYRKRFGFLSVAQRSAPSFELHSSDGTAILEEPTRVFVQGQSCSLPALIQTWGSVRLRASIHSMTCQMHVISRWLDRPRKPDDPEIDELYGRLVPMWLPYRNSGRLKVTDDIAAAMEEDRNNLLGMMHSAVHLMLNLLGE